MARNTCYKKIFHSQDTNDLLNSHLLNLYVFCKSCLFSSHLGGKKNLILSWFVICLGRADNKPGPKHCRTDNTMIFLVKNKYYWEVMYKEIKKLVEECKICKETAFKQVNTKNRVVESKDIGDLWNIDLIGRIEKKNKFILVCVDRFSK